MHCIIFDKIIQIIKKKKDYIVIITILQVDGLMQLIHDSDIPVKSLFGIFVIFQNVTFIGQHITFTADLQNCYKYCLSLFSAHTPFFPDKNKSPEKLNIFITSACHSINICLDSSKNIFSQHSGYIY